jgi:hypothetical protein
MSHRREELMDKTKAMAVMLIVFLLCQPFSAAASKTGNDIATVKGKTENRPLSEASTSDAIYIVLVKPLPDSAWHFPKAQFKQELQRRLELQMKFAISALMLALMIGLGTLAVGFRAKQRTSEFAHIRFMH